MQGSGDQAFCLLTAAQQATLRYPALVLQTRPEGKGHRVLWASCLTGLTMLLQGQAQASNPTGQITGSCSKCLLQRFPPFSPVSYRKLSGLCFGFLADYSQSLRQVVLVVLVQRGF